MAVFNRQTITRLIKTNALRKGLLGGSPLWRAIWVAQLLRKGWSRISKGGEAPVTFSEPLGEGTAWTLVHVPEDSARGRGEGRRLVVGPKRARPRASAIVGPALSAAGAKILEAPSAERINAILGEEVVSDPPLTRRARRKTKRTAVKTAKQEAKLAKKTAKSNAKLAKSDAKAEVKLAKQTAKSDAHAAKVDAKANAKVAKQTAKTDAHAAKAEAKDAKKAAKAKPSRRDAKLAKADAKLSKRDAKVAKRAENAKPSRREAKNAARAAKDEAKLAARASKSSRRARKVAASEGEIDSQS